jgi:hypothetical protein
MSVLQFSFWYTSDFVDNLRSRARAHTCLYICISLCKLYIFLLSIIGRGKVCFRALLVFFLRELLHLPLIMDSLHGAIRSWALLWLLSTIHSNLQLLPSCQEFSLEAPSIWEGFAPITTIKIFT